MDLCAACSTSEASRAGTRVIIQNRGTGTAVGARVGCAVVDKRRTIGAGVSRNAGACELVNAIDTSRPVEAR